MRDDGERLGDFAVAPLGDPIQTRVSRPARFGGKGSIRVFCVIPVRRDGARKCDGRF